MVASAIVASCSFAPPQAAQTSNELVRHGRVALPAGVTFEPGTLHVTNSLGSRDLARDGSFELVAYRGGPQFTLVTDDAGDPVLAGFVGATHATIDTASTAKLLLFFASGCYTLAQPFRSRTIDALASAPGFARVERALDATLRADSTALGRRTESDDALASALDRFVATARLARGSIALESPSRLLSRLSSTATRRVALQRVLRRYLVPLASAVLVPIDSPSIDAGATADARPAPMDELAAFVSRRVPAISTFVDQGQTGDAFLAAYTSTVDSDAAHVALFATVRHGVGEIDHRAEGEALYDTASSIFATWNILGSAFTTAPAAVISERTTVSSR